MLILISSSLLLTKMVWMLEDYQINNCYITFFPYYWPYGVFGFIYTSLILKENIINGKAWEE